MTELMVTQVLLEILVEKVPKVLLEMKVHKVLVA